jgi:hypothetical protein
MAQLREQVLSVTLNETDREEIRQHATHLDFEEETWGVNPGSLLKFLKIVHDASMPDCTPITYLALFETHVGRAALSAFGYAACPSFLIPSGRSLDLTKTMPAANVTIPGSRKRKSDDSVDDFVLTVQVQLVDYARAANDWIELTKTHVIRVIPTGNKNDNIRVYRGKMRGVLWEALSRVVQERLPNRPGDEAVLSHGNQSGVSEYGTIRKEDAARDMDMYL